MVRADVHARPVAAARSVRRYGPVMARVWLWCAGVLAWSVVANLGLGDAWYVTRNLLLTVLLLAFVVRRHG
jgi:hypothetical protein